MNKKTKTSENTSTEIVNKGDLDAARAEATAKKIMELLEADGMMIQAILSGYPFMLRPEVKVVPKPEPKAIEAQHVEEAKSV